MSPLNETQVQALSPWPRLRHRKGRSILDDQWQQPQEEGRAATGLLMNRQRGQGLPTRAELPKNQNIHVKDGKKRQRNQSHVTAHPRQPAAACQTCGPFFVYASHLSRTTTATTQTPTHGARLGQPHAARRPSRGWLPGPAMLSPSQATRRADDAKDDDGGLTQSLRELSLSSQTASSDKSPLFNSASSPLPPPSRRSSTASARPRLPSRSPSRGRESRNTSPTLIRKASLNSLQASNGVGRRSSSARLVSPTARPAALAQDDKPPLTPQSVARAFFQAELDALHGPDSKLSTDTIVVLNDAVYGHRFSRPRTSRGTLSTIVERPERIKAGVLGISAAYIRIGGRHSHGTVPVLPVNSMPLASSAPFRIHRTDRAVPLLSPAVTNVHGTKWMDELRLMCDSAESRLAMGAKELQRPDASRASDAAPAPKLHEGDLYLCAESRDAIEGALGAVCEAVDAVFTSSHRRAFVGARPPGHHCSASHPSGFCWVNNVHVGVMHAALAHGLTHAAIIDFDLHHGDGSQAIAWEHNSRAATAAKNASAWKKTSVGYFSIHDINSYPCEMGDEENVKNASLCIENAHGQTIWNVHLEPWKSDSDFWRLYDSQYALVLDKTRKYLRQQAARARASNQTPRAVIFLSAGFDASEWESVGMQRHQVNVPTDFYARISRDVVKLAAEEDLHVDGRVVSVLEGGYSDRALFSGILSHLSGLVGDPVRAPRRSASESGTGDGTAAVDDGSAAYGHDPAWWSSAELDKLQRCPEPPSPPRKPRNLTPPTYSTPTQASTAKVVDPNKMRRSLSGLSAGRPLERAPTPPPPEVSWVVAAHELAKLLIPAGRQTDSCGPEDLNAEATRARRDRQSMLMGIPPPPPPPPPEPLSRLTSRMALRERKPRVIVPIDEEAAEPRSKSRRRTVAAPVASPEEVDSPTRHCQAHSDVAQPSSRAQSSLSNDAPAPKTGSRRLGASSTSAKSAESPRLETDGGADRPRSQGSGKLAVKKTRTTAAPRKEGAAPTASKAARPPKKSSPANTSAEVPGSSAAAVVASNDLVGAVEGITTGMKIRINLITQSQKEARQKAEAEAKKAASAANSDTPSVNPPTAHPSQAIAGSDKDDAPSVPAPLHAREGTEPAAPLPPRTTASPPMVPSEVEGSSPPALTTPDPRRLTLVPHSPDEAQGGAQPVGDGDSIFIAYQPEGSTPVPVAQKEPLKWMPPNVQTPSANTPTATPSQSKGRDGLFHYTSGIPFGPDTPSK